ncbi:MAG: ribonuclease J [Rhodobacteraceae bacterium]|nr:MAG: ribonuclease J [Paracoccaceae bacterium]
MADTATLVYAPLGGAGEIGMNMYLYGFGPVKSRRWIMVDCGIGFGDMETSPGVELIVPDTAFVESLGDRLEAIFITHAHEDHVGAIGRLWRKLNAPVWATRFTAEIAKRKMQEEGLSPKAVKIAEYGGRVQAGPFSVEFIPVTHSTLQCSALAIRTEKGVILHTADFKIDDDPLVGAPFDIEPFRALGREGVLAMAIDSTNVFSEGSTGSEGSLRPDIERVIRECEGAVAATSFASNVVRLKTLAEAAAACDRSVVIAGRAMRRMIEAAVDTGLLKDFPPTVPEDRASDIPDRNLFYLLTGSQGEHRAALARVAAGVHPTVSLSEGDTVLFSSRTIPGNEAEIYRLYNRLSERGVRVIDADMARIHASGHACRDELRAIYEAVKPRIALPMHGEHRHLVEHAASAKRWGADHAVVAPNGSVVALDGNRPEIVDEVETGRVYLDGSVFVGALDGVIRDRLKLARQGHVVIALVVDEEGDLLADPEVRCIGAPVDRERPLDAVIAQAVDDAMDRAGRKEKRTDAGVESVAARAARKVCFDRWGKKPVTTVIVTRLEDEED